MQLCSTCSSTLDASASLPSHSEKSAPPTTFACGHRVCGACVAKRRRLAQSCILCSSLDGVLAQPSTTFATQSTAASQNLPPSSANPPSYSSTTGPNEAENFVLGDSDDEEVLAESLTPSPPPADEEWKGEPPAYAEDGALRHTDAKNPMLHYLRPEETLAGLALRYGVEGHVLCTTNKLPISTLSTTPHLLHTLPFLLLPPGSRASTSTAPLLPEPLERKRLVVRRFQMQTKCSDWAMAQAYVDQVFRAREEETRLTGTGEDRASVGEGAEGQVREGGELEEAVEAYLKDERWEKEQQTLGKPNGKGVFRPVEAAGNKGWWR
ncbi:hypothetical protein JCM11641_003335 [Rhodosporidiobolus odoratus]